MFFIGAQVNDMKKNKLLKFILIPEVTSIIPILLVVFTAVLLNPAFLRPANLQTLGTTLIASWGILAVGQAFVIMVGELDVAVGATFTFAAMFFCYLVRAGMPLGLGILLTFALCLVIQLISAGIVLKAGVSSFITTLAMSFICKGMANVMNYGADLTLATVANTNPEVKSFLTALSAKWLGLSVGAWVFIGIILFSQFLMKKTEIGRKIYAVGDNKVVARVAGLRVNRIKILCFCIMAATIALAAILWVGYYSGCTATQGLPWGFISIAAVAMGGVSLSGGTGSMLGVFCGVVLMALIYNLITLLGVDTNYQNIFIGCFLALSVILDVIRRDYTIGKNI